ncbi:hypothetical protein [Mycobacterium genavense]|uniref:hypothetical protein n=1 Tax=Mycobacterium genavense TaxID=36812 RepID=UPI0004AD7191|nr:hypothetical protein [Mycobacterium genavense]
MNYDGGDELGLLAGRLLFAVEGELFRRLRDEGFDDIVHRHGAVLAHLRPEGVRATDLARLSGQVKQVIGSITTTSKPWATSYARRIRSTVEPSS